MNDSDQYLANLYKNLGDLKSDFRNYNLTNLISSKVRGKDILDIGCGNGILVLNLNSKGMNAVGLEPNNELIELARQVNPKLKIIKGYAEDITKINKRFDSVVMMDVLEHIKDDEAQLQKIHNSLNDDGQIVLVVPAFKFLFGKRDKNNGHYRRYSKKDLINKLSRNGFKIKKIRYWNMAGFFPYLFYEKVLHKELNSKLRTNKQKSALKKFLNRSLNQWFKNVENNISFGFGLSIICVANKKKDK